MALVQDEVQSPSDAELIDSVRAGSMDAYAQLYERHVSAAYNLARQMSKNVAEADDLVSDAFAKVLDTLRAGKGPDAAFRAYLLTALRHNAYDRTRRDKKVELSDDVASFDTGVPFTDTAVAGLEKTLAAQAFALLPERWQAVLWHTEVEQQTPAEIAPILGLSANSVSALAYRAREGLRQAYLQVHLASAAEEACRATVDRLGAWTRGGLSRRETVQVEAHLDNCAQCRALAAELADVNGAMRFFIAPLVLGGAVTGYLALSAGAAKAAGAAAVVGAGAAGVGAATGGSSGAASAASAVPRQLLATGASAAAVVAAVAVALTSGSTPPPPSVAQPPAAVQPAPTAKPPAPPQPPPPAVTPPPPPVSSAPSTAPAPPPPASPQLSTSVPSTPIQLTPGGPPVDLPVTVRNTGTGISEPVTAALTLPPGVQAEIPGAAQGFARMAPIPSNDITCQSLPAKISCATKKGLAAGESVTFAFRLTAGLAAQPGVISGSVNAGAAIALQLTAVQVQVKRTDGLELTGQTHQYGWWWPIRMDVTAHNKGSTKAQLVLDITLPERSVGFAFSPHCQGWGRKATCTTDLAPGQKIVFRTWLTSLGIIKDTAVIKGKLGTATAELGVPIHIREHPGPVPTGPYPSTTVVPNTENSTSAGAPSPTTSAPRTSLPTTSNRQGNTGTSQPTTTTTPRAPKSSITTTPAPQPTCSSGVPPWLSWLFPRC